MSAAGPFPRRSQSPVMRSKLPLSILVGAFVVAIATASLYVLVRTKEAPQSLVPHALRPDDAQLLVTGARVYASHCAACHGVRGEGQPNWQQRAPDGRLPAPPHDASGHTWHHPDAQLFAITKHGLAKVIDQPDYRTDMPVYDGVLRDEEIVAALSWIKAQWPAQQRQRHDEINAQYAASLRR